MDLPEIGLTEEIHGEAILPREVDDRDQEPVPCPKNPSPGGGPHIWRFDGSCHFCGWLP